MQNIHASFAIMNKTSDQRIFKIIPESLERYLRHQTILIDHLKILEICGLNVELNPTRFIDSFSIFLSSQPICLRIGKMSAELPLSRFIAR